MASRIYNKSQNEQEKLKKQAEDLNRELLTGFFNMKEADKAKTVSVMLFNLYIVNTAKYIEEAREKRAKDILDHFLKASSITNYDTRHYEKDVKNLISIDKDYHYTNIDVLIASPNGKDILENFYMDEIKNSDVYKNIMTAKNQEELEAAINAAAENTENGLGVFNNVSIPDVSKEYNDGTRAKYEEQILSVQRSVDRRMADEVWSTETEGLEFADLHVDSIQKNAMLLQNLFKEVEGVDYKTSSPNFKAFKREFRNLVKLAEKYAKLGRPLSIHETQEYTKLAKSVLDKANIYLVNKTNINSKYAKKRVEMVQSIKKRLSLNIRKVGTIIDSVRDELNKGAFGDMMDAIDKYAVIMQQHRHVFLGNHSLAELDGSPFSLGRSAGYSISVFVLLNKGYDIKDIMDVDKLKDEKAEIFDEVLRRCKSDAPEDKKWIAKQMYEGFKCADNAMDALYKKVDFTKDFLRDQNYAIMHNLSGVMFDVYQEISHVIPEINSVAKEDPTYDSEKNPDFMTYRDHRQGIIALLSDDIFRLQEPLAQIKLDPDSDRHMYDTVVRHGVAIKYLRDVLLENQNKDISYTELAVQKNNEIREMRNVKINTALNDYTDVFYQVKYSSAELMDCILDTSLFKNVKFHPEAANNKDAVSNLPTKEEIIVMAENQKFLKLAKAKLEHLENDNFDKVEDINNYVRDAAIVAVGEMFKRTGTRPIDPKTNQPITLENASKSLAKNKAFQKMMRQKTGDKKLKHPKNLAHELRQPETILKIARVVSGQPSVKKTAQEHEKSKGAMKP